MRSAEGGASTVIGDAIVIPAGTRHNVINTSKSRQLKLYTVYSPPNHPPGTLQKTEAATAEHHS